MAYTTNNALETLKKESSVRVYTGMIVVFPQFSKEEALNVSELAPKFNGCLSVNNSTVCYVHENEVYVTPYTRSAMRILREAAFAEKSFYVPFSNWDFPKTEMVKWNSLREKARKSYEDDFVSDCIAFCDEHHIGTINDETLHNCMQMPASGVPVKHLYFEDTYYPILRSSCLDCVAVDKLGKFCSNNGRVVFVYRDGKTYVTKGYKIISELRAAGYTESGLFVPFSNGEMIQDPILSATWEAIKK